MLAWRDEKRFAMTSNSRGSRVGVLLIALVLTIASPVSMHAVEDARKLSVVSFGLFGDQGVFRNEATGAAQVVADRFGSRFYQGAIQFEEGRWCNDRRPGQVTATGS